MTTITETGRAHLRWALTDGVGPLIFSRLLVQFGSAEAALGATAAEMQLVKGISRDGADRILRTATQIRIENELDACAAKGVRIVARADPDYPAGLREVPDPPIALWVKGELRETDAIAIAVVGTRRCSIYGSEQARRFGELLAGAGFTVISGLARGIDAFAHHGAVDAGGRSIAVMGNGLNEIYPPENTALAEKLIEHGALLSELPMATVVRRGNFLPRNRIIAGMSLGTIVVEAPARSGALATARLAMEYNREVFAVPGRLQEATAIGTNKLIQDGAKLVTSLEDILIEFPDVAARLVGQGTLSFAAVSDAAAGAGAGRGSSGGGDSRPTGPLSPAESAVLEALSYDPMLQEFALQLVPIPPGEALAAVTSLELKGLVRRLPGQQIVRVGRA
ncbi:MAG: DNA-protecting protein DprA [Phycisphaerales bacterium]|nr:DNA-protecting protein DprA [Phycisphaerales bacterium]